MLIPKKVRIGDRNFRVKVERIIDWSNNGVAGQINFSNGVLKIKKNLTEKEEESTFFHEIAHGILKEMEFNYPFLTKYRNDEVFVQEFGLLMRKNDTNQRSGRY